MAKVHSHPLLCAPHAHPAPVEASFSELEAMMDKLAKMSNQDLLPFLNRNVPTEVLAFHRHFSIMLLSKDDFDMLNYAKMLWMGLAEWRLAQPKSFSYFYFLALHLFETEERVDPCTKNVMKIWVYNRSKLAEKFAHYASRDCVLPAADDLWLRLFRHVFQNAMRVRVLPSRKQWKFSLPLLYLLVEVIHPPVHFERLFDVLWDAISNNPTLTNDQQKRYQSDKICQVLLMYAKQYRHASPNIRHPFQTLLSKLSWQAEHTKQHKLADWIHHLINTSQ
jgi:hypothetical protein